MQKGDGQIISADEDGSGDDRFVDLIEARVEPDERQGQRADAEERDDDHTGPKIPLRFRLLIQEFSAVLALDGLVLDLFGAIGALLHSPILTKKGPVS